MYGDIRDDWKIQDIEQKVNRVRDRMYELDTIRSNVDRLECESRKARSDIAELRFTIQTLQETITTMQEQHHERE